MTSVRHKRALVGDKLRGHAGKLSLRKEAHHKTKSGCGSYGTGHHHTRTDIGHAGRQATTTTTMAV